MKPHITNFVLIALFFCFNASAIFGANYQPNYTGTYVDSLCNLRIQITEVQGQYYYTFTSSQRTLQGKATIKTGVENTIILEGIEYAEDYFDLELEDSEPNKEYEELRKNGKRTIGIACSIDGNEIGIQNYGNAMNHFVKLGECGQKFIVLKK